MIYHWKCISFNSGCFTHYSYLDRYNICLKFLKRLQWAPSNLSSLDQQHHSSSFSSVFFFPFLQLLSLQFLCSLCPRRWVQRGETIGRWEREREIDFESHGLREVEERNWKLVIYFQVLCVGRWNWLLSLKVWQSGKLIKFFLIVKSNWFFFPSPSHDY